MKIIELEIYPEIMGMGQEVWLTSKDKIEIKYENNKKLLIKQYYKVQEKVEIKKLKSEEIIDGAIYNRMCERIWIDTDKTIEIIDAATDITSIKILIEKVEG